MFMDRENRALSRLEKRSWERVGQVLVPGNATLPRYDYAGASAKIPAVLAASNQEDEELIRFVVLCLGCLPLPLIRALLTLISKWAYGTGAFGTLPRLLLIGTKGVLYTTYYAPGVSNKRLHDRIVAAFTVES